MLWSGLAQQGQMIGIHDSWIAASCIAHDLTLVTANLREFNRVPGLRIENWLSPSAR
jgi:tRNA(fMet)-specific endonuclease VapC